MTYKVQTWVHCLFSLDLSLDFKKLNFFMFFKTTSTALVVLNKLIMTFGKKSNLKFGLIQTRQLH